VLNSVNFTFVEKPQTKKSVLKGKHTEIKFIHAVVGDYINIIKTTLDFYFDLNQAVKQHGYT